MNEAETRAEHIDPALKAAGWGVVEGSRVRREYPIAPGRIEGFGRRGKPLIADYVLEYRNRKLAVDEAKAWDEALTEGVGQAKNYAGKLDVRFAFATNGQGIYAIDMKTGKEGEIAAYPTPDELWAMTFAEENAWRERFTAVPFEDKGGSHPTRYYQDNEKTIPTVLTTSQKLSTGVDARNVRNIVLMRPINQIIDFKQIIGRGTRLYDGKDYFTIYDFVKAHQHFSDPEWDGEPLQPEPCPKCGCQPCACVKPPPPPCPVCGQTPCVCPPGLCPKCGRRPCVCRPRNKVQVKLADGKDRTIQHMMMTSFWHPDGTPMSAQQFMELLFGKLPDFFKDEAELRLLWSAPDTRKKLLQGLAEKGFGHDQLTEMQKVIDAENSDLFDVLAHVAYALPPVTREVRAANARVHINTRFNAKQQAFLDFVLQHYISVGVEELDQEKLTPLLLLKYHNSLADAVADLGGRPEEINKAFAGFQKYLYQQTAAA